MPPDDDYFHEASHQKLSRYFYHKSGHLLEQESYSYIPVEQLHRVGSSGDLLNYACHGLWGLSRGSCDLWEGGRRSLWILIGERRTCFRRLQRDQRRERGRGNKRDREWPHPTVCIIRARLMKNEQEASPAKTLDDLRILDYTLSIKKVNYFSIGVQIFQLCL